MLTKAIIVLSCLALLAPLAAAAGAAPAPAAAADSAASTPIPPGAQVITTEWTDADGMEHTLSTERKTGETVERWGARHAEALDAFTDLFPPA